MKKCGRINCVRIEVSNGCCLCSNAEDKHVQNYDGYRCCLLLELPCIMYCVVVHSNCNESSSTIWRVFFFWNDGRTLFATHVAIIVSHDCGTGGRCRIHLLIVYGHCHTQNKLLRLFLFDVDITAHCLSNCSDHTITARINDIYCRICQRPIE